MKTSGKLGLLALVLFLLTCCLGAYALADNVAKIGNTEYATLAEAIAEAGNTQTTITMIADENVSVSGYALTIPAGKNIVLELAGHQIIGRCEADGTSALIRNLGTLTINDSTDSDGLGNGDGKIIAGANPTWTWDGSDDYSGSYASNLIRNEGTLTVNGGLLSNVSTGSAAYAIDNYSAGKVTINGGKLVTARASTIRMFYNNGGELTITGGIIGNDNSYMAVQVMYGTNAKVDVSGGVFNGSYSLYSNGTGTSSAKIKGGQFNGYVGFAASHPTISISGGQFAVWTGTWGSQTGFITGGVFAEIDDQNYLAEGYKTLALTDSTYKYAVTDTAPSVSITPATTTKSYDGSGVKLTATVSPETITENSKEYKVAYSYQWAKQNAGSEEYTDLSDETNSSYTTGASVAEGSGTYQCTVKSGSYTVISNPATVKINPADQTISADNMTVTYGDTGKSISAKVTNPATGGGEISYAVKDGSGDYIDVDQTTGALTIKKAGTATVVVTAAETANCTQATKEVTVTIQEKETTVIIEQEIEIGISNAIPAALQEEAMEVAENTTASGLLPQNQGDTVVQNIIKEAEKKAEQGGIDLTGKNVLIVPSLKVTVTEFSPDDGTLTMDITALYSVYATTAETLEELSNDKEKSTLINDAPLNTKGRAITIRVELPDSFAGLSKLYVRHIHNGKEIGVYEASITKEKGKTIATFVNPNGFSDFIFTLFIAPKAMTGLVYDGTRQELVTPGQNVQYALGGKDSAPAMGWSGKIPTGTEAGIYYVWYRIAENGSNQSVKPVCLEVIIEKGAVIPKTGDGANPLLWLGLLALGMFMLCAFTKSARNRKC